jgi:hypothetical protein
MEGTTNYVPRPAGGRQAGQNSGQQIARDIGEAIIGTQLELA